MASGPENPFKKPEAQESRLRNASERDRRIARILSFFSQRGTQIFNCAEAWLLRQGYKYEEMDGIWSLVPMNYEKKDWDYGFEDLIKDLRGHGYETAANFVQKYIDDGYPEKGFRAYLADHNIPEERFEYHPTTQPSVAGPSEAATEKKEELDAMNLLTNREAVINALIEMEGSDWYERHQPSWKENSIDGALAEATSREDNRGIIYGVGGWHRYSVDSNGNVRYIESKGKVEAAKAKELGFKLI